MGRGHGPAVLCVFCLLVLAGSESLVGQAPARVIGRVFDVETGESISDATVTVDGLGIGTVSNDVGLFVIPVLPPGPHVIRFTHIAYLERVDSIRLRSGQERTLRVNLSTTAIELDPLMVQGRRSDEQAERASGTARNVVSREELEPMINAGQSLEQVLVRHVTGVQIKPSNRRGGDICLEFRSPRSLEEPGGCKSPSVFLDGVRVGNPEPMWDTFPIDEIQRLEVIPSSEAGARFGAGTNYGVLIIETRTGNQVMGVDDFAVRGRSTYDWSLESESYPWFKVFATTFVGNGLGVAAGALIGQNCFQFEEGLANSHFFLESQCGGLASAGSAVALFGLPIAGATYSAGRAGRTELSQGRAIPSAIAAAIGVVPGYILVVARDDESFSGSRALGWGLLTVGVPIFTTIADRLFREFRGDPLKDFR